MTRLIVRRRGAHGTVGAHPRASERAGCVGGDVGPIWIVEEVVGHLRSRGKQGPASRMRLYRLSKDQLIVKQELDIDADTRRADLIMSLLALAKAQCGV